MGFVEMLKSENRPIKLRYSSSLGRICAKLTPRSHILMEIKSISVFSPRR